MKKYLLILACAMMASFTANASIASGECGDDDDVYWAVSDDGTTLTISGSGYAMDYDRTNAPWYAYREGLTTLVMDGTVCWFPTYNIAGTNITTITSTSNVPSTYRTQVVDNTIIDQYFGKSPLAMTICPGNTGNVVIPDGCVKIQEGTIYGCKMSSIEVPASVTTIVSQNFINCPNLRSITLKAEQMVKISFSSSYSYDVSKITVYVPADLVETYKDDINWEKFIDIVAIPVPTGVTDVNAESASKARKVVKDGQIVIEKDGKQYNVAGMEIK